jgi:hypothetical protein
MLDVTRTIEHVVGAIDAAVERREPFHYLQFSGVFPADVYAAMLESMPEMGDYGAMSGRASLARTPQGDSARTKIDLFPECMNHLPEEKTTVWARVGEALRSSQVREAFVRRLAPGLERRFGPRYGSVKLYPIPTLMRDVPGYRIGIHSDTRWKGMTVQIYLPRDASIAHVGTVFHRQNPDSSFDEAIRMPFSPNTGYAFAVGSDTYHSVDTLGPEVRTRDSILVNYFVDETWLQVAQNRCKRLGHVMRGLGWQREQPPSRELSRPRP